MNKKKHFVSFIKVAPSLSQDGWRSSSPGLHPFSAEWFLSLPPSGVGSAEGSTWSWCLQLPNLWLDELMSNVHPKGIPVTVTNIMMFQPLRSGFLVGLMGHKILLITYLVYCCSTVSNDKTPIKQMCPRWLDGAGRVPCYKMNLRQK